MNWAEPHDAALKVALDEGCTFSQAAKVLSDLFKTTFTRNSVIGRAGRQGLSQPYRKPIVRKPAAPKVTKTESRMPVVARQPEGQPIVERTVDVVPRHISIYELNETTCHWPFGNDGPPFTYCGCETFGGGPWCEPHDALSKSSGTRGEQMALRGIAK